MMIARSYLGVSRLRLPTLEAIPSIREGVISAFDDTMKIMVIAATCVSVLPILISLVMPNWYLGDTQNAVDDAGLAGERVGHDDEDEHHNDA